MEHFMTLISLIVLGYNFLPWNLAAELSLSSRDSHCWKKTCSGVCKSQLPAAASPPRHAFLQLFCQTLTSSRKEQVQLLEVINSAAPITPLLKSREWSQVPCRNWQRLGVCGNSCWADASFSHCNSLLLFCLCQSNWGGAGGQGESLLYRVLHFTAANYCSRGEWPFAAGHVAAPGFHSLLQQYKFLCHD